MSHIFNSSNINQTFIIEPLSITGGSPTLSACTTLYSNAIVSCSGDTTIFMGNGIITFDGNLYTDNDLSASTINASTFYSGGTNLLNLINSNTITGGTFNNNTDTLILQNTNGNVINVTGFTDYYTTGTTTIGNTVYFNRNDLMSAYTMNLAVANSFVTGTTFLNNQLFLTRNDNIIIKTFINNFTGLTVNGVLSATTIYGNGSNITGLPYVTGGTYLDGVTTLINSTGGTFNINGYFTGDTNIIITGISILNNTILLTNNTGGTISTTINTLTGLTVNGSLSATTYLGLPIDVRVTGGTYSDNKITLINNTGGTFNITGVTDYSITGGTFTKNTKQLRLTKDNNVNIDVNLPIRLFINSSATTTTNTFLTIDTVSGITDNTNSFIVSYINAFKDNIDYGFWKRTLAINKVSGITYIIGENSDFDRISSGMTSNSIIYSANNGNISIKISGETSKNYTWSSNWEIIK